MQLCYIILHEKVKSTWLLETLPDRTYLYLLHKQTLSTNGHLLFSGLSSHNPRIFYMCIQFLADIYKYIPEHTEKPTISTIRADIRCAFICNFFSYLSFLPTVAHANRHITIWIGKKAIAISPSDKALSNTLIIDTNIE